MQLHAREGVWALESDRLRFESCLWYLLADSPAWVTQPPRAFFFTSIKGAEGQGQMPKLPGHCRWKENLFTKRPTHTKNTINAHFLLSSNLLLLFALFPLPTPCLVVSTICTLNCEHINTALYSMGCLLLCVWGSCADSLIILTYLSRGIMYSRDKDQCRPHLEWL